MQNNFFILCFLFLLIGCSSKEELDLKNYKNVFKTNNEFSQTKISEKPYSKLDNVKNLINIFNAKSHNIENPSFDYPLEKKWEIDTDQNINDENPFLAEPIIISSHLFLINNKGFVFKININSGKIVWKKNFFKDLGNTILGAPGAPKIFDKNCIVQLEADIPPSTRKTPPFAPLCQSDIIASSRSRV